MSEWFRGVVPVALLATGACFATRSDVRVLQNDMAVMRAESMEADSMLRLQTDSVLATLARMNDSLRVLSSRFARFQGDTRGELYALGQQLITVQELTGQSQRRLQELRASMDQRVQERSAAILGDTAVPASPGPNQLFQLAVEQLRRGSAGAARLALEDLMRQYPTSDVADDAQFFIAESFAQERNEAAADSVYQVVIARFPNSSRAPTSLYKRALMQRDAGRTQAARSMLEQLVQRYPRSDEAALARDLLGTLK